MRQSRLIILLFVVAAVLGGGYLYMRKPDFDYMKQQCVDRYQAQSQSGIIEDVDGFCSCSVKVRYAGAAREIRDAGRACMDQYGKKNLIAGCEEINADMKREEPSFAGVDCECFYDKMITFYADEAYAHKGDADKITAQTRKELTAEALRACRNKGLL